MDLQTTSMAIHGFVTICSDLEFVSTLQPKISSTESTWLDYALGLVDQGSPNSQELKYCDSSNNLPARGHGVQEHCQAEVSRHQ